MSDAIREYLPCGFVETISGGTRQEIKLSRPWQPPITINPEKCPFCTQGLVDVFLPAGSMPEGWRLIKNKFTPYEHHNLIIPTECLDVPTLQELGNFGGIRDALEIARQARFDGLETAAFAHVGVCAGQNLGHLHWHVIAVPVEEPLARIDVEKCHERVIESRMGMVTIAAGIRAGQCLIIDDRDGPYLFDSHCIVTVAAMLNTLISRANVKFKSVEGKPPEYSVSVRIAANGDFRYASYCPILNHWGATEYVFAPLEGGPYTLPWPHEVTAAHLRGE